MSTSLITQLAQRDFERAMHKAMWRDWLSWLTHTANDLLSFDQLGPQAPDLPTHYLGLESVPLDKIVGSERCCLDFDRSFLPRQLRLRDRWVRIDQAYYEQITLPPVELLKVGDGYFVVDGNHRVSVACARGQKLINAFVTAVDVSLPAKILTKYDLKSKIGSHSVI